MYQGSKFAYLKHRLTKPKCKKHQDKLIREDEEMELEEEYKKDQAFQPNREMLDSDLDSEEEMDTNVVAVDFDFLKNINNIAMGDPVYCQNCKAVLNKYSKILNSDEYLEIKRVEQLQKSKLLNKEQQQQNDFIMINQKGMEIEQHEKVWKCEFCSFENKIRIEQEEIPQQEDVIYIIESLNQKIQQKGDDSDFSIIFCLDNSGSMSVTTEVKGQKMNLKHGLSEEEYNMLKQFIDPGDEMQMMPGQKNDVTYVSRKQCVLAAIEQQLSNMSQEFPKRKVGVVTFNDEVILIGDGHSQDPTIITGDKLNKTQDVKDLTLKKAEQLISHTIKDSLNNLKEKLDKIEEKGRTALGPALLAAITMAGKGKPGSMVVICTDGLANCGLGSLDQQNEDQSKEFYQQLSQIAKEQGIVVSVITIKGEGCKIEVLGQLAEETNGTVTRVDPKDISKDFAAILKDEVVGTNVVLEVQLHQALQFRNEDKCYLKDQGSKFYKEIGNATINTKITFEYQTQPDEVLQQYQIDIEQLKQIPFQARVFYNSIKGDRYLRVLSQIQNTTNKREEAEKQVKVEVLHQRIGQQSSNYVQQGRFKNAQKYNSKWSHYVMENQNLNNDFQSKQLNQEFHDVNYAWKKCANKKASRQRTKESAQSKPNISSGNQKKPSFLQKMKKMFSNEKNCKEMQEEDNLMEEQFQMPRQVQQLNCQQTIQKSKNKEILPQKSKCNIKNKINEEKEEEEQEEQAMFSASDNDYSSDEDKDEAIMINFKQCKVSKK